MEQNNNANSLHTSDKLLKIGRIVADVKLGFECAFFLVFGIAATVNSSLVYLLMVFLGPAYSFASWMFERVLIAIGHDVKTMHGSITGTSVNTKIDAPDPAPTQEAAANATTEPAPTTAPATEQPTVGNKIFCMSCGTENDIDSKFCGKCGAKLL